MKKKDYIIEIQEGIISVLKDFKFNNYKRQLISKRLNANFNSTYSEEYLWNKTLYIANNSCVLLGLGINDRLTSKALKESAEVYELLYETSDFYDREYSAILSAICYDLSGYQANAVCMLRLFKSTSYSFYGEEGDKVINEENYILTHIQGILLKNIFKSRRNISKEIETNKGMIYFNSSLVKFYDSVLNGNEHDFITDLEEAYNYYMDSGNIPISHLLFLLKTRIGEYKNRSIWYNLNYDSEIKDNPIWQKYIKLLTYDLYNGSGLKNENNIISRFELWISQLRAIDKGLLIKDENFIIQMPTSAGKTFIAEISILNNLIKFPEKKCIYVAPFRTLTSEKQEELSQNLGKLGYIVSSLSGSYEVDFFQDLVLKDSDVLIATPEKIDLLFRLNPEYFENVSLMVIDEGHIVGEISPRSTLLEFLIIRLKIKISELKILFISAVMPSKNAGEYSMWLNGNVDSVIRAKRLPDDKVQWEPTRKLIGKFEWVGKSGKMEFINIDITDEETREKKGAFVPAIIESKKYGRLTFPKCDKKSETASMLGYKLSETGNTLIFCSQPRFIKGVGESFLKLFSLLEDVRGDFNIDTNKESYYYAKIWYGEDSYITKCIGRGIGIHFGDMPEQVRHSVENDFRSNKLRILISTNTIGQGINLPLKNLIFHSTLISENNKLLNRDFWNIVGRVGRAGKETEGQIIFLINTLTDKRSYDFFIKKSNLEPANSLFFTGAYNLEKNIINIDLFEKHLQILSEPYLFDLLSEDILSSEEIIDKLINNSLFKVQLENKNIDIAQLRNSFINYSNKLKIDHTPEELKMYGKTGFSLKSNKSIISYIIENESELYSLLENDEYIELLKHIFKCFDLGVIEEVLISKFTYTESGVKKYILPGKFLDITLSWINGDSLEALMRMWNDIEYIGNDSNKFYILISQGFFYRYTWGVASFISILCSYFNIENDNLSENIKNLSSYIKNGLNTKTSCFIKSLGIKNRNICKDYGDNFSNIKEISLWLSNITENDINIDYSDFDKKNILEIGINLSNKEENDILNYDFYIKGISYNSVFKNNSLKLEIGDTLKLLRDNQNKYDPYSILVENDGDSVGYIPRNISKLIVFDMDIDNKEYLLEIVGLENKLDYNNVICRICN